MGENIHLSNVNKVFLCLSHSKTLKCFFASKPRKKLIYSWSFENELPILQCTNKLIWIHMGQMFHNRWVKFYFVLSRSLQSLGFLGTTKKEMCCTRLFLILTKNLPGQKWASMPISERIFRTIWTTSMSHTKLLFTVGWPVLNWFDGGLSMLPINLHLPRCRLSKSVHELTTVSGIKKTSMKEWAIRRVQRIWKTFIRISV